LNAIMRYIPNQRFYIETDAIIHLAGKAHDLKGFESIRLLRIQFWINKQLFDAFQIQRLLYLYLWVLLRQQQMKYWVFWLKRLHLTPKPIMELRNFKQNGILSHVTYGEKSVYLKTLYDSWSRKQGEFEFIIPVSS
jgi:hypothetical protein